MQIPVSIYDLIIILDYFKGIPCSAIHRAGNFLVTITSRLRQGGRSRPMDKRHVRKSGIFEYCIFSHDIIMQTASVRD